MQTVVVGGGYAGLRLAQRLALQNLPVILVEPRTDHILRTRLVAAAAGRLPLRDVALPFERLLPPGIRHLRAVATGFDPVEATVETDYEAVKGDRLVIALGSEPNLSVSGAPRHSLPLYSYEDLEAVLGHWSRLEEAMKRERCDTRLLRWVIVGGGLTGVELAAELVHLARRWRRRYGTIAEAIQIHLVERSANLLPTWPVEASEWVTRWLRRHNVIVQLSTQVRRVRADAAVLETPAGQEDLPTQTLFWAVGTRPVKLDEELADLRDRDQFLRVDPFCRLVEHPRTYAVGDVIQPFNQVLQQAFAPSPTLAVRAAEVVAANIVAESRDLPLTPFVPTAERIALSLGAFDGVALVDGQVLTGLAGWTVAQAADLLYLNSVQNPLLVSMNAGLFERTLPGSS